MSFLTNNKANLCPETPDAPGQRKQAGLKRMRRTASCLPVVMIALLLASVGHQAEHPWPIWLQAFAEAGTIGAIADWYAVVALFWRPFGLPIPHTAIIAQNQQRIAESLGNFVEQNFLTPEIVIGKLRGHNAAKAVANWLAHPANSRAIAELVGDSIAGLLNGLDDADAARFFERTAIPQLRTLDVSRLAGNILEIVSEGNRHQQPCWIEGCNRWSSGSRRTPVCSRRNSARRRDTHPRSLMPTSSTNSSKASLSCFMKPSRTLTMGFVFSSTERCRI